MLQPDPKDILASIYIQMRNPGTTTAQDEPFEAPPYAVRVNCFLFAGLFTSMLVALLGILVKQWMRSYQRELAGVSSPHLRARIRHFRFNGAKRWHLASIVGLLSIFMHLALFISAVGIIDLLLATAPTVGYVALSVFLIGATFFFVTTLLPIFILDAPFRSPLSIFLSGLRRRLSRIRAPAYLRERRKRKTGDDASSDVVKEEGLEDHIQQSQGGESDENSIVRTKIHLDLDIICHLLSTADKSTERWLLDLCFEKLPNLHLLEQNDAHAFNSRDIIIEVYNFLARGCIMSNKNGEDEVNSDRLPRARQLCKFMAWYLTLPRTPEENERLAQNLEKGGDPTLLAKLLAKDENTPTVIVATTALGQIEHFRQSGTSHQCSVCQAETSAITKVDPDPETTEGRDENKVHAITSLLIKRTDCLRTRTEPLEKTSKDCADALAALQTALDSCNPTEKNKKLWLQVLKERETGASISLKEAWFTPLRTKLNDLQIKRGGSPFRPADNPALANSNVTLQPPRLNYPNPATQARGTGFPFHRQTTSSGSSFSSPATSPSPSSLRPPFSPTPNLVPQ
ncbi:hypothetical protein M408DRAFT_28562 [Serendipita vermifera MAFF 305830]|uniref:DUF6535 domain-containing protein n=1 Tax=Serendipita vermifera MAFF 305830 TaxID=933852 RepID=A0A0C2WZE9_SERVB|nr:hypothetical protein M408DRAFT_28562 [Serendipita vermifera MAFF 305830]